MTRLTRKGVPWLWTEECQTSFVSATVTQQLKYLAARAPRVIMSSSGITHKDKKQRRELRLRVQRSTGGKMRSKLRNYYKKLQLFILVLSCTAL